MLSLNRLSQSPSGYNSSTLGYNCTAFGDDTLASGKNTIANGRSQHVLESIISQTKIHLVVHVLRMLLLLVMVLTAHGLTLTLWIGMVTQSTLVTLRLMPVVAKHQLALKKLTTLLLKIKPESTLWKHWVLSC